MYKMPSGSLSFCQTDSSCVMITPRGRSLIDPDSNIFDQAFKEGLGLEEWDDWMRWEGATTELLPTSIECGGSIKNCISSPGTWAMGLESSSVDVMSTSYATGTEFPFADAPFELEDTPPSSASSMSHQSLLPLQPMTVLYPTQGQVQQELRKPYRRFSLLTEAEERSLQDIAMPYHALSNIRVASVPASPIALHVSLSPSPEPEVRTRKTYKRKSTDLGEVPSHALCQSRKRGHNAIEKKYRSNLNARIESLREGVPSFCGPNTNACEEDSDGEGIDNKPGQQKCGKAAILMRALEYIQHLESTSQRLSSEVDAFKIRVGAFEKLAISGSTILNGSGMEAMRRPVATKSETLESIQSDFQQIKAEAMTRPSVTRRRGSRQTKAS